jgi:outer membrane protein
LPKLVPAFISSFFILIGFAWILHKYGRTQKQEESMQKKLVLLSLILMLCLPVTSHAFGIEIAGGSWYQSPDGHLAYDKISSDDKLDIEDDLNYDDEFQLSGRLILDMPLFIPNIYLMATPMNWDETGQKNGDFNFGGINFQGNVPFKSELKMNHIDAALFYGLPFIETGTAGILNIDLGLNVRIMGFRAEIEQEATGLKESESYVLPIPMVYLGVQLESFDWLAFEGEGRGIGYSGDYYYSLIGRLKLRPFGPFFIAGGYRYDDINIDYQDVLIDAGFGGPFAEVGFEF